MEQAISPYKAVALKLTSLSWFDRWFMLAKLDRYQRSQVWQQLKPLKHLTQSEAADLYLGLNVDQNKQNKPLSLVAKLPLEHQTSTVFSNAIENLVEQTRAGQSSVAPKLAESLLREYDRTLGQGVHNG